MSDLEDIWHDAAARPAKWPSAGNIPNASSQNRSLFCEENTKIANSRLPLSSHQKADSNVLSAIIANGRIGELISDRLITHFGSLAMVISSSVTQLQRFGGLTKPQILTIKAVHTAALRLVSSELDTDNIMFNDKTLIDYLVAFYSRSNIESFRVLFLNSYNGLICDDLIASGTINHVMPYPREIIRRAIEIDATALILVHNHPSGDPTPSPNDIENTICICDVAAALQLRVHDHIIVADGKMVSLRSLGLLRRSSYN